MNEVTLHKGITKLTQSTNIRKVLAVQWSKAVVLKLFGSWATFVFQKPFAGHKN